MLNQACSYLRCQRGDTLLEVLIAIVIVAFGLLGFAGLEGKIELTNMESYQRAQANALLAEMVGHIRTNSANAASYLSARIGTGDGQPADCTTQTIGSARDICEWSNALKGAAEQKSSAKVGAMIGAIGCITQVQAPNPTPGVCTPGVYQVTVAWQGLNPTVAPASDCGRDLNLYGSNDALRRVLSERIIVGLPSCI